MSFVRGDLLTKTRKLVKGLAKAEPAWLKPMQLVIAPPQMVLPEFNPNSNDLGFGFSSFFSGGSMELMAVPKRKVSPHKRGIRNGPKALKPTPVIVRCRSCGRVKLPHFYCCSGEREKTGEPNN
ncbi:uncharacterized protein LOC126687215 [Mercurialis annua]|uniref:uncharacterized protein LOC126687215 n=1 Tax=Mercurialis annua TaxID=3986 RepID=UPI002160FD51|nr:uncharacterized protein LOC126687215 [Mercurialis annua]